MGSTLSRIDKDEKNTAVESDDESFQDAETYEEEETNMNLPKQFETYHTDAVQSKNPSNFNIPDRTRITFETVKDIENELSFPEKVSLVFLLYDQEDLALQSLLVEKENLNYCKTINSITTWAQSKHTYEYPWQERFIEALCIIQNYAILQRLGFAKNHMIESYLPSNPYVSLYVNKKRKALYAICESLTIEQNKKILNYLNQEFDINNINRMHFEERYLEVYLLHCFSTKFINNDDFTNLISIFKKLDLQQQICILEHVTENKTQKINDLHHDIYKLNVTAPKVTDNLNTVKNNQNVHVGSCSDNSIIGDKSLVITQSSNDRYYINPENVGICLIIDQYEFYTDEDQSLRIWAPNVPLKRRDGSEFDQIKLSNTFKNFGFRIKIRTNCTSHQILQVIEEEMKNFSVKDSCFIVCILSHGIEGAVYGVNSVPVYISSIENQIHDRKYHALWSKPKILIIQSCQGEFCQKVYEPLDAFNTSDGIGNSSIERFNVIPRGIKVPEKKDLLILMSTVSGYASIRNEKSGSWFIQEFCRVLEEEYEKNHVQDIMTIVINNVSNKIWPKNNENLTMVPQGSFTFSKKLYFQKVTK